MEMSLCLFPTRNVRNNIKFVKKEKTKGRKRTNDSRAVRRSSSSFRPDPLDAKSKLLSMFERK